MPELQNIELSKLVESKTNPRQIYEKQSMAELVESIKKSGIVVPLVVRVLNGGGKFEIVAGSRRYRAAVIAELATAPSIVRQLSDEEALELQIIENDQRIDVHPLEQCAGYQQLQKKCNFTVEQLATHLGKSPRYVAKRLQFANLIEPIRKLFLEYKINSSHAIVAARLQPEQQKQIVPWLKRGDSADGLQDEIERHFFLILKDACFDTTDATLVPKAGACLTCPKRTGANKALFDDITQEDICTDRACFEDKERAHIKRIVGTHKDAVLLSLSSQYNNFTEPKHLTEWVLAGEKNCPDTKEGVVVEKVCRQGVVLRHQDTKPGAVVKICTNMKCKTHHKAEERSRTPNPANEAARKADRVRRIELQRRGLMFKELAAEPFTIDNKKDYRAILDWAILQLSSDDARAICYAMAWEVEKAKYGGKDYTGTVQKHLAKLEAAGIHQWLYLIMLAGSELWMYVNSTAKKPALLEAKAKQAGCEFSTAAVVKFNKEKKDEKKKAKKAAKPKSTK